MAEISVLIVTWNADKFIKACLDSVFSQLEKDLEVIVYDNGSTDETLNILNAYGQNLELIKGGENKGFCYANNQALKKATGEFILTLNSDVVLNPGYINHLKEFLKKNEVVGLAQGKCLRMDKKTIDCVGIRISPAIRFYNIGEGELDSAKFAQVRKIFGPCAAAAMYRRKMVEQIKVNGEFFDNKFFFLVEDFDVAWRAARRNWQAYYVPDAVCCHFRDSSNHHSKFRQYLSFRNRFFLLLKNAGPGVFLRWVIFSLVYDLPRLAWLLVSNPYALRALKEMIGYSPVIIKRRLQGA